MNGFSGNNNSWWIIIIIIVILFGTGLNGFRDC